MPLVDARKTSLTGVQNTTKKNRLAATLLVDDAPHRRWVKPPPPLKKARSAPVGLCKTTKRKDQLYMAVYLFLYGESSVKISTQTD